jgi:hypothetical protein
MHRPARIEGLVYGSRVIQVNYPLTVVHGKCIVSRSFFFRFFRVFGVSALRLLNYTAIGEVSAEKATTVITTGLLGCRPSGITRLPPLSSTDTRHAVKIHSWVNSIRLGG